MTAAALDGVLVLDLTSQVTGAFAGKLLADLGAEVVMLEPTDGSTIRNHILFDHMAGGKKSIVPADGAAVDGLVRMADIVLCDGSSPWHARLDRVDAPQLVRMDLSSFGLTGPYKDWKSSDLVTWSMGGYEYFTGAPDREPIQVPGRQSQLHAGAQTAIAALVALHERERSGVGQRVEVSDLEATLAAHAWLVSSWAACGMLLGRQPGDLIRATDGWVYVMRIVPKDELFVMIDRPDLADENLTVDIPTWTVNIPRIFEAVAQWAADKTVSEIVELGQLLRVAVTPVLDARGVMDDEQLADRNWWESDPDSTDGVRFPGQPYKMTVTPSQRRGRPPRVGEHNGAVLTGSASTLAPVNGTTPASTRPPMEDLRIIEVTTNWAGPIAGRFLADLGADSIKIEWATRPATRALFWVGPKQDLQRQAHHRSMYFNELNRNKRSVCVDMSKPEGRLAFLELVKTADVVLENNSARVMPNFGLGYEDLRAVKPDIIMVSMSGYGASGPHRDWVAYGANIETTSSLTSVTGYPDGQLSRTTLFYADPVSGNYATIAILAALRHRDRTGEGQWVDISLNECGASFCAETLIEYQQTGTPRPPMANRDPFVAPQGVYRCIGTDNWVAVTVQSHAEWVRLANLIGRPDLAADPAMADLAVRRARHDELDAAISAWTAGREHYEIAHAIQAIGVAAGPVLANWQILPDPHIYHRGMYATTVHPVVGAYPTTTWPWRFERTQPQLVRHGPLFAEHNREVLKEAGLDDAAIAALYESGITADNPVMPE